MSWAQKRKLLYLSGIVVFAIIFIVVPSVFFFYKPPTCFDSKQNQSELGVDCGGPCVLLCNSQYSEPTVLWSRFSKVTDGVYNVLAYIENPNLNASTDSLGYTFKLYDKQGILLRERSGQTFVPANKRMAVFEPELLTGNQIPSRVEFSFTSKAVWTRQESMEPNLSVSEITVTRVDSSPRLTALVTNKTISEIKKIEAVGIVYNAEDNTIAFSRTIIDSISGRGTKDINFNWPKPFTDTYARAEVILKVLK